MPAFICSKFRWPFTCLETNRHYDAYMSGRESAYFCRLSMIVCKKQRGYQQFSTHFGSFEKSSCCKVFMHLDFPFNLLGLSFSLSGSANSLFIVRAFSAWIGTTCLVGGSLRMVFGNTQYICVIDWRTRESLSILFYATKKISFSALSNWDERVGIGSRHGKSITGGYWSRLMTWLDTGYEGTL